MTSLDARLGTLWIKQGATVPKLLYALSPDTVSLENATVRFRLRQANGGTLIDTVVVPESNLPPVVGYAWAPGDTDVKGQYEGEFQVTYENGDIASYPSKGFIRIRVEERIPSLP